MSNKSGHSPCDDDPQVRALQGLLSRDVTRGESQRRPGLRWVQVGDGDPVVLVPGAGEVCLDWVTVLPELAASHQVVAYDRPGLGASRQIGAVSLHSQLDDLANLLEEVGPGFLVGHSWGGLLAELVTLEHPHLVRGLVLVDPFREDTLDEVPWRLRAASSLMLNGIVVLKLVGVFPRIASSMGRALAGKATQDERVQSLLVDAYLASYSTVGQVSAIRRENLLGDDSTKEVRAIRRSNKFPDVPMVILTPDRGKPAPLQRRYADLAATSATEWPNGSHIAVSGSGHYIHHDQPGAVVEAVAAISADRQGLE